MEVSLPCGRKPIELYLSRYMHRERKRKVEHISPLAALDIEQAKKRGKGEKSILGNQEIQSSLQEDLCKVVKNAGLTGVGDIFFKVVSYLVVWIVVRVLGPAQYGIYLLSWAILTFASVLAGVGFSAGLIKFVSQFQGQGDKPRIKGTIQFSLYVSLAFSIGLVFLLVVSAGFLEIRVFKKPLLAYTLRWLSLGLPFVTCTSLLLSSIQGFQVIKYRIYVEKFCQPLSFLFLVIVFFALGSGLQGLILARVSSVIIGCVLSVYFLNQIFPLYNNNIQPVYEKRRIIAFSSPLIAAVFLNFFVLYTDILMLGYFKSSQDVGIYGVLIRIVPTIILPLTSFEIIFSPMVADLFSRNDLCRMEDLHKVITKWICLFSLPIFWLIVLFARPLLQLFGPDFVVAQIPMIILAIGQLSRALVGISGYMVLMTGHPNLSLVNNAILFGLNTVLNYYLIPPYGIYGAALATSFSYALVVNMEMIQISRILRMHPYSVHFFKPLVSSFLSFTVVFFLTRNIGAGCSEGLVAAVGIFLFIITYTMSLKFFGFTSDDKFIINKIKKYIFPEQVSQEC